MFRLAYDKISMKNLRTFFTVRALDLPAFRQGNSSHVIVEVTVIPDFHRQITVQVVTYTRAD